MRQTTLATFPKPAKIRQFLREWANMREEPFGRLGRRYPEFHPPAYDSPLGRVHLSIPTNWTESLRTAWRMTDTNARDWKLAQLLCLAGQSLGTSTGHRADWARNVSMALTEAVRLVEKLAVCAHPECTTPLFIRERKNAKVCSADCRDWMQRKWTREWWEANGESWRANRCKKKSQRRAAKKKRRKKENHAPL